MKDAQNIETLLEVVRTQQGTIKELQIGLDVADYDHVQTENRLKCLQQRIDDFADQFGIKEAWAQFNEREQYNVEQTQGA